MVLTWKEDIDEVHEIIKEICRKAEDEGDPKLNDDLRIYERILDLEVNQNMVNSLIQYNIDRRVVSFRLETWERIIIKYG
jgi:hypothetical protein